METLAEMVERVGVKRDGQVVKKLDSGNPEELAFFIATEEYMCVIEAEDASNAVLAELLRRLVPGCGIHRWQNGWQFECVYGRGDHHADPLTALYAAYERFPELFAQPAKGVGDGE